MSEYTMPYLGLVLHSRSTVTYIGIYDANDLAMLKRILHRNPNIHLGCHLFLSSILHHNTLM
jgi:hypothetical protein